MATNTLLRRRAKNKLSPMQYWRAGLSSPILLFFILFLSTPISAGPPTPFDNWTNSGGTISSPCPTGFSCETNVLEPGIMQRMLTDRNTGQRFIQLIIADGARNNGGHMLLENFVEASSGTDISGTALKQVISQRGEYNMDYSIVLNTGWADTPNDPTVIINQTITDTTPEGVAFDYSFDYQAHLGPNDAVTGYYFGIRQDVTNSGNLNGSNGGGTDTHAFVLRRASGSYVSGGSATLPAAAGGMGGMGAGAGGMGAAAGGGAAGGGAGGGGGGMMMANAGTTTGGRSTSNINVRGGMTTSQVRINGTSTGLGDAPCGSDPLTNITPGEPPPCSTGIAPPNPGSQGTGTGAGAAAPGGTLTVPPRGGGTIPVPAQPPGAGGAIPMGMGGGGPAGGTVTWSAGNEVQVIWIGQVCPGCVAAAMGGMGGANGSFSYQAYENLSTGATAATRTIFGATPFTWNDPPFGPAP